MIKVRLQANKEKEIFYIGAYDAGTEIILKIGTTNSAKRRQGEYRRALKNMKNYPGDNYRILWKIKLSKANTLRAESQIREKMKEHEALKFVANDRFLVQGEIPEIELTIRKVHKIPIKELLQ